MTAKTLSFAAGLIAAASPLLTSAAAAQSGTTQNDYDRGYQAGRADAARADQGYDQASPPSNYQGQYDQAPPSSDYQGQDDYADASPPADYDATQPPPPPPGYTPEPAYAPDTAGDQRYGAYAEDWAARYCVRSNGNTASGAVIGGLFGALLGSSIAGRHDRGAGALMGGIAGAAGGAAVGNAQDNATSPGCPPGYVMRGGAPTFAYDGYNTGYTYAAPGWYRPWIYVGGRWSYRPYPYHNWYYRNHSWGRPGYHRGWRGGYRRRW
jgi:hypothetical protein